MREGVIILLILFGSHSGTVMKGSSVKVLENHMCLGFL